LSIVSYFVLQTRSKVKPSQTHGLRSGPIATGHLTMSTHYTATAKALHWGIAVLILGILGRGL
jgi:hypothetical protein